MKVTIIETGEEKELVLLGVDAREHVAQAMSQADYDWWIDYIQESEAKVAKNGGRGYINKYPLELLVAIINQFYEPDNDAEVDRLDILIRHFDDAEGEYRQIKDHVLIDEWNILDGYSNEVKVYKFGFSLTDVLVPVESEGGVVFKNVDLEVETQGVATEFFIESDIDEMVIKTPYYKDSYKHLNNASPSWVEDYFNYMIFWGFRSDCKSLGELSLNLVKQKSQLQ